MTSAHGLVDIILGGQWGDEGKGKMVDQLACNYDYICRCQGGSNAGHTVVFRGKTYFFHLLPSGLCHESVVGIIGNGVVVSLADLKQEIEQAEQNGLKDLRSRLLISNRAPIVFQLFKDVDVAQENFRDDQKIGTTKKGIGPCYSSKVNRTVLRLADLVGKWEIFVEKFLRLISVHKAMFPTLSVNVESELETYKEYREYFKYTVTDTCIFLNKQIKAGKSILVEGANGFMLDIDFGTYPNVTSSNCAVGGVFTGLGISPKYVDDIIGVFKAYSTRVGSGPFPTELNDENALLLQRKGKEVGVTTGRVRRCGWLDCQVMRYSAIINGFSYIALTKLDVLSDLDELYIGTDYLYDGVPIDYVPANCEQLAEVKVVYEKLPGWCCDITKISLFENLPVNAQEYVKAVERLSGLKIKWVSIGPSAEETISLF